MSVGEMAAVREIHCENFVARLQHREINGHVRLCAAVRLHIHVLASEESLGAIDRQLLGSIDILATAVPALSRIRSEERRVGKEWGGRWVREWTMKQEKIENRVSQ